MSKAIYYHNPRCSKSRQGLELIKENDYDCKVKEYLKEGFTEAELIKLFALLGDDPIKVVRTKENIFRELSLKDKNLSAQEWAKTICQHPILLERPLLATDKKAVIGRPPENLLPLISKS